MSSEINYFNSIRFPLIALVVVNHTFSIHRLRYGSETLDLQGNSWIEIANFILDVLTRGLAVPVFFFMSGYLFYRTYQQTWSCIRRKFENRIMTLLIPYIIWNLLAVLVVLIVYCFSSSTLVGQSSRTLDLTLSGFLFSFWDASRGVYPPLTELIYNIHPQNAPLWFVRDLMIAIICSPLIFWLLKKLGVVFLTLLGLAWFSTYGVEIRHLHMVMTALFFFAWGGHFCLFKKRIVVTSLRVLLVLVLAYVVSGVIMTVYPVYRYPIIKALHVILGIYVVFSTAYRYGTENSWSVRYAPDAFFVYMAHGLVYGGFVKLLFYFIKPRTMILQFLIIGFAAVATIALLIAIRRVMQRYMPITTSIITGGRTEKSKENRSAEATSGKQ